MQFDLCSRTGTTRPKAELLSEVIAVAVAGDDEAVPLNERPAWAAMLDADGEHTLTAFADARPP